MNADERARQAVRDGDVTGLVAALNLEAPYVPMAADEITHHIAGVVLGWQREGGWSPSGGEDALIAAAFSLDIDTARACLPKGLCDAVELYRSGGAAALRDVMEAA